MAIGTIIFWAVILLGVILAYLFLFRMYYSTYDENNAKCRKKVKYPVWIYIIMLVCLFIPIVNLISMILPCWWVFCYCDYEDAKIDSIFTKEF